VIGIASFPAHAQEKFPSKDIEVISHAAPGGGTDTTIRTWLPAAQKVLGQDMVVVYKQGGGARAAQEYFKSRPADGYTIMALTQTHLYTIARGNSPITIDDMKGLVRAMDDPSLIVVRPDSPYQTYEDFVEASNNEALTWGVAQVGGTEHIGIVRWAEAAGAQYRVVPFGSGGEMITALRSGAVEATLANVSEAISAIQEGDLKPLAALADERVAELPDLPTAAEKGHDVSVSTTRGYAVRADTPPERVKVLEDALLQAMKGEQFQDYLRNSGLDPETSVAGSEVWDQQLKAEYAESKAVIDRLGLAQEQ
jgi:putative tricarboxylic transport membrane protein